MSCIKGREREERIRKRERRRESHLQSLCSGHVQAHFMSVRTFCSFFTYYMSVLVEQMSFLTAMQEAVLSVGHEAIFRVSLAVSVKPCSG